MTSKCRSSGKIKPGNPSFWVAPLALFASMVVHGTTASAVPLLFSETEAGFTETFILDSNPTVSSSNTGQQFVINGVAVTDNGGTPTPVNIIFYNITQSGGYAIGAGLNDEGPQLYTGAESDPAFILGTTTGNDTVTKNAYSLTISDAISTPEPASIALLGAGLFGLRLARRRRTSGVR
jgi:PEP-CTERM motif